MRPSSAEEKRAAGASRAGSSEQYRIQAIDRAVMVLNCYDFEHKELGVRDISALTGLHKATAHRILVALEHNGFIEQDPQTGNYHLGLELFRLGHVAGGRLEVRGIAHPFLSDLTQRVRETSHLAVLDGVEVLYLDKVEGPHALRMPSRTGWRVPSYCTSLGKAILACFSDEEVRQRLARTKFVQHTPHTLKNLDELIESLKVVRRRGYAVDEEEVELGLSCIAAPLRDHTGGMVGAISISAPTARMRPAAIPKVAEQVKRTAELISTRLGYGMAAPGHRGSPGRAAR